MFFLDAADLSAGRCYPIASIDASLANEGADSTALSASWVSHARHKSRGR